MASTIFAKRSQRSIEIISTDPLAPTIIWTPISDTRMAVSGFSCHASSAATVTFYESADALNVDSDIIASEDFAINDDIDISTIMGSGFDGTYITAVATAPGVKVKLTYTLYTEGSI